jgi:hypothetical protein
MILLAVPWAEVYPLSAQYGNKQCSHAVKWVQMGKCVQKLSYTCYWLKMIRMSVHVHYKGKRTSPCHDSGQLMGDSWWSGISVMKVIRRVVPCNNFKRCLFYLNFIAATCFGPCWPSSGGIHSYFRKLLYLHRICCFVLLGPIFICLANSAVVHLMCICELSKRGQITSLLNVKNLKMVTC